jgi:hypothetical protein
MILSTTRYGDPEESGGPSPRNGVEFALELLYEETMPTGVDCFFTLIARPRDYG